MSTPSQVRDTLNSGNLNQLADALKAMGVGELLSYAAAKMVYTETGISTSSNVATLANPPTAQGLFQCVAASGTVTGVKKLRRGPVSGANAIVPNTGECVWDGGKKVLFAAVDAVATASFTYAVSTDIASLTMQDLASGISSL